MEIIAVKLELLVPPKDDLFSKILASKLKPKNGDIIAVSSKVVSIHEGSLRFNRADRQRYARKERGRIVP